MKKLRCYYAHTMLSYNSTQEKIDVELLESLGFEVVNPNAEWIKESVEKYIVVNGSNKVMDYFNTIIIDCDLIAFRALPNGDILSGIASELTFGKSQNIPIIELPCSLGRRMLDYPATKEFLIEVGHYKLNKTNHEKNE